MNTDQFDALARLTRAREPARTAARLALVDGISQAQAEQRLMDRALDDGYRAMAADKAREAEAIEWCNALAEDMADAAW
jgi:hypothetical protein